MNYDLTLNSYRIGRDRCVDVMKDYIDLKFDGNHPFRDKIKRTF